jgi:hypothetical protein
LEPLNRNTVSRKIRKFDFEGIPDRWVDICPKKSANFGCRLQVEKFYSAIFFNPKVLRSSAGALGRTGFYLQALQSKACK